MINDDPLLYGCQGRVDVERRFNPAQKQNVKRKACKKCQSTGWCHARQKCEVTGRALRIVRSKRPVR